MRHEVNSLYERALTKALILRTVGTAVEVGVLAIVLDRLKEIRDSQHLPAPAKWEDLKPHTPSDDTVQRGIEAISAELDRIKARDEMRKQKVADGLRELGL